MRWFFGWLSGGLFFVASSASWGLSLRPCAPTLFWEIHEESRSLSFELVLQTSSPPLRLRFAQMYVQAAGQTLGIHTFGWKELLAHALVWSKDQQRWLPSPKRDLPSASPILLFFPTTSFPRDTPIDTLLLTLHLQESGKPISRSLVLRPQIVALPRLRFPVRGRWWVAGGHQPGTPHRRLIRWDRSGQPHLPQRFALDLLRIDRQNQIHKGEAQKNTSYLGFGTPLLAPASGVVVALRHDRPDQPPGQPDLQEPLGNYVVLRHRVGLFSLLAQLQARSILVRVGDTVRPGQPLARVGNSGNGATPHLHFQLMDRPDPLTAESLPAVFWDIVLPSGGRLPFVPKDGQIFLAP